MDFHEPLLFSELLAQWVRSQISIAEICDWTTVAQLMEAIRDKYIVHVDYRNSSSSEFGGDGSEQETDAHKVIPRDALRVPKAKREYDGGVGSLPLVKRSTPSALKDMNERRLQTNITQEVYKRI